MKSIYDIINEANNTDQVFTVKGPDGSIVSVWTTKEEADKEAKRMSDEAGSNGVFTVEADKSDEFVE